MPKQLRLLWYYLFQLSYQYFGNSKGSRCGMSLSEVNLALMQHRQHILLLLILVCASFSASCPAGSFQSVDGCVKCPPGFFNEVENADKCKRCISGTYSKVGSTSCTPCPKNSFSPMAVSDSCYPCNAGTVSAPGSATCNPCKAGYIRPITSEECKPCPKGTYYSNSTSPPSCIPCAAHTYAEKDVCHTSITYANTREWQNVQNVCQAMFKKKQVPLFASHVQ